MELTPKHDELARLVDQNGTLILQAQETQMLLKSIYLMEKSLFHYESILHEYDRLQDAVRKTFSWE